MHSIVRTALTWLLVGCILTIAVSVAGEWFIEVARDKEWYKDAGQKWDLVMSTISGFLLSGWMLYPLTALGGYVVGLWTDKWLALNEQAKAKTNAIASARENLSEDQSQFRIGLKHFALHCAPRLIEAHGRVFTTIKNMEKEQNRDSPNSIALHMFIHFAWSSWLPSFEELKAAASSELKLMDVDKLQELILHFLNEYRLLQSGLANLNDIVKADLNAVPQMSEWLELDKTCRTELERLKVWPEAGMLKNQAFHEMASVGKSWATPVKINY